MYNKYKCYKPLQMLQTWFCAIRENSRSIAQCWFQLGWSIWLKAGTKLTKVCNWLMFLIRPATTFSFLSKIMFILHRNKFCEVQISCLFSQLSTQDHTETRSHNYRKSLKTIFQLCSCCKSCISQRVIFDRLYSKKKLSDI